MTRRLSQLALLAAISAALLGAIWPRRPVAPAGGWYDTCVPSSTVWCMDFEGTGGADSDDDDTVSSSNGVDLDCGSGTGSCPLEQSLSARISTDFGDVRWQTSAGDGTGWPFQLGTGDVVRCAGTFMEEDEGTTSSGDQTWWRMYVGGSAQTMRLYIDWLNEEVCVRSGNGGTSCSSAGYYTDGVAFTVCWEYDYDADLFDLYDTSDCSGTPVATSDGTSSTAVDGGRIFSSNGGMVQIIDNLKCEANPA